MSSLAETEPIRISWSEFAEIVASLAKQISADGAPQQIVAIKRGGLIPAVMLSHSLRVRDLLVVDIRRTLTDDVNAPKQPPTLLNGEKLPAKDTLFIDDIAGTGETLRLAASLADTSLPRIRTAACLRNSQQWSLTDNESPTYVGKEVVGWVLFPWELGWVEK